MRAAIIAWIHLCRAIAAELGPWLRLAAVIIPGGTLLVLLVWLYRHRQATPRTRTRGQAGKPTPPPASYNPAIANAKAWLGDRYLLAHPIHSSGLKRWERVDAEHA